MRRRQTANAILDGIEHRDPLQRFRGNRRLGRDVRGVNPFTLFEISVRYYPDLCEQDLNTQWRSKYLSNRRYAMSYPKRLFLVALSVSCAIVGPVPQRSFAQFSGNQIQGVEIVSPAPHLHFVTIAEDRLFLSGQNLAHRVPRQGHRR
jgi:hypothetical protein